VTYIDGALVAGWPAHVIDRVLARHLAGLLADPRLSASQRRELEQVKADIRKASRRWEASISDDVSHETRTPETAPPSEAERVMVTAEQASALLGVGVRRTQQLAAGGLGLKVRGRWLLDAEAVTQYRREGRDSASKRPDGRGPQAVRDVA
jgi:phage terminase Nu1 subunit (DNA packaging protein)